MLILTEAKFIWTLTKPWYSAETNLKLNSTAFAVLFFYVIMKLS